MMEKKEKKRVGIYLTLQNKYLDYKLMVDTLYSAISIWSLVSINGSNESFVKPNRWIKVSRSGWPMGLFSPSRFSAFQSGSNEQLLGRELQVVASPAILCHSWLPCT